MKPPIRKVVCAACYCEMYKISIVGPRHWDATMHKQFSFFPDKYKSLRPYQWEQGCIDQFGVYMDREEAFQVAKDAGQQIDLERNESHNILFSEGLY